MILSRYLLTLLGIVALQRTGADASVLEANDQHNCVELCKNCAGTATFEDNVCHCHVSDDNQKGAECIARMTRKAGELGLDVLSYDLADPDADRAARCIVSPFRRFRSRNDADLIAKYFVGNGLGSLLGSAKSQTEEGTPETEDPNSETKSSGDKSDSNPALVSAPNPFSGANPMSSQLTDVNPLLGVAATWLQPDTLLAFRNGIQGSGTQGFVAQPDQNLMTSSTNYNYGVDSSPKNLVGSTHQDTASDSVSTWTQNSYNPYAVGTVVGMSPYSYLVGSPNSVTQDGSQPLPMQSYLYNYNSMVGAQNPLFMGASNVGPSPFWYQTPLVAESNPQLSDPVVTSKSTLNNTDDADEALTKELGSDPSLGEKKNTDFEDKTENTSNISNELQEPVVSSKQTAQNLKNRTANSKETKSQVLGSSSLSTKRRQGKFRLEESNAKPETTLEATSSAD